MEVRFLLVGGRLLLAAVRFWLAAVRFVLLAFRFDGVLRCGPAAALRDVERTELLVVLRDAAAFNSFPLFGFAAPGLEQDAHKRSGAASLPTDSSRGGYEGSNLFSRDDPELWSEPSASSKVSL